MIKIDRLDHLVLTVKDLAATHKFYGEVLGMEVVTFAEGRTALRFGIQKINLHEVGSDLHPRAHLPTAGSGDLCFITSVPMAEVIQHLNNCGVKIVTGPGPRTGARGVLESVYIRDPDQNLIEISNETGEPA
jgi:catechol 2,3-dioxygenase-like lactoylglutathione lyase family enzyme